MNSHLRSIFIMNCGKGFIFFTIVLAFGLSGCAFMKQVGDNAVKAFNDASSQIPLASKDGVEVYGLSGSEGGRRFYKFFFQNQNTFRVYVKAACNLSLDPGVTPPPPTDFEALLPAGGRAVTQVVWMGSAATDVEVNLNVDTRQRLYSGDIIIIREPSAGPNPYKGRILAYANVHDFRTFEGRELMEMFPDVHYGLVNMPDRPPADPDFQRFENMGAELTQGADWGYRGRIQLFHWKSDLFLVFETSKEPGEPMLKDAVYELWKPRDY